MVEWRDCGRQWQRCLCAFDKSGAPGVRSRARLPARLLGSGVRALKSGATCCCLRAGGEGGSLTRSHVRASLLKPRSVDHRNYSTCPV